MTVQSLGKMKTRQGKTNKTNTYKNKTRHDKTRQGGWVEAKQNKIEQVASTRT